MSQAIQDRQDYEIGLQDRVDLRLSTFDGLKEEISNYLVNESQISMTVNLLWNLEYIVLEEKELKYVNREDSEYQNCLFYRRQPDLDHKQTLILSATTRSEYLEKQGFKVNQSINSRRFRSQIS